ncbi:MAG: flagellar hook-associated protein FlgL [Hydrogenophilus sp.]|nr:flagellar hook-associated protein FlgL [Hydrogenophilus sp.]
MLRVATSFIYDRNIFQMQRNQREVVSTQQQVASGRKMVTPADDPVRSARSLELQQSQLVNRQFLENLGYAQDVLRLTDSRLSEMTSTLQYMRDKFIQAGNAALTPSDRAAIAEDLRAQLRNLVALGNSQDGVGNYLFAGYKNDQPPLVFGDHDGNPLTADRYYYRGDANVKQMKVGETVLVDVTFPGSAPSTVGGLFGADQSTFVPSPPNPPPTVYPEATFLNDLYNAIESLDPNGTPYAPVHGPTFGAQAVDRMIAALQEATAKVGSQLAQLDGIAQLNRALDEDYTRARSRIEDTDYHEALSRLAQQQMVLQAAQQSFVKVSNLSLFNYL